MMRRALKRVGIELSFGNRSFRAGAPARAVIEAVSSSYFRKITLPVVGGVVALTPTWTKSDEASQLRRIRAITVILLAGNIDRACAARR